MKKRKQIGYSDESIGRVRIVEDFLPSPDELVCKEEGVKVTLVLSKASVDFFKNLAKKNHTQYQKMIRTLLDKYTAFYKE